MFEALKRFIPMTDEAMEIYKAITFLATPDPDKAMDNMKRAKEEIAQAEIELEIYHMTKLEDDKKNA